jgi:predicted phage-related endonuclease
MSIIQFGLTAEQILKRREGIGGSDANIIMGGDQAAILRLWEEKTGQREGEDLSRVLPVQMGTWTEPLNRHWYTLTTGNEVQVCEGIVHPQHTFMRCLLDGFVPAEDAIFEAKHVNQFAKADQVAQKYMGQLHHNMACAGKTRAVLSIFIGTMTYEHFMVEADPFYTATLIEAEEAFWNAVQTMTPPGEMPAAISPETPKTLRTVDMRGSNEWGAAAADWLGNRTAAKKFSDAEKNLKALVEFDVGEAVGAGIVCKRAKNGSLTIREAKNA